MTTIEIMISDLFGRVRSNIEETKLIAWDGCHKIYMAMDEVQSEWFRNNYKLEEDCSVVEADPTTMLTTLAEWWEESCFLRFIQAVSTDSGYTTMIDQGEDYEDEDEDEDGDED